MSKVRSEVTQIFGDRLRTERNNIGVSQMDLAELSGIHFTNLARIERGEANPSLHTIVRIASALGTDPANLVQGLTSAELPDVDVQISAAELLAARKKQRGI